MRTQRIIQFPSHRKFTSWELADWAIHKAVELKLKPPTRLVLHCLTHHAGFNSAQCWPSVATIAMETGLSRRTVFRELDHLESTGLIARQARFNENGKTSSKYTLKIQNTQLLEDGDTVAPGRCQPGTQNNIINRRNNSTTKKLLTIDNDLDKHERDYLSICYSLETLCRNCGHPGREGMLCERCQIEVNGTG